MVGEVEQTNNTVSVRTRDNVNHGEKTRDALIAHMKKLKASRSNDDSGDF